MLAMAMNQTRKVVKGVAAAARNMETAAQAFGNGCCADWADPKVR